MKGQKLGKKIKEARLEQGFTQEELGEKVDTTGSYIGQIERGERNASMNKILAIAKELNVSVDYLTGNLKIQSSIEIEQKIIEELKDATNSQKELIRDIIKIIKKYR